MRRALVQWALPAPLAGLLAVPAWRAAAQAAVARRIGYLSTRTGYAAEDDYFAGAMRDLGHAPGTVVIEYRWAGNDDARLAAMADELVAQRVDVIVCDAVPAIRAAMRATATIPIVIVSVADPVSTNMVATLAHPGGNVTGVFVLSLDLVRKRLELIREIAPRTARLAVLGGRVRGQGPPADVESALRAAGREAGIAISFHALADARELNATLEAIARERPHAILVLPHALTWEHRAEIVAMATRDRLPDIYEAREFVVAGGLASYGAKPAAVFARAASYVDRILKGAKPAELAVEQPTALELVVSLGAARARGLSIPESVRVRADEILE
jgi:putative ABC transport system substrate-binding protein